MKLPWGAFSAVANVIVCIVIVGGSTVGFFPHRQTVYTVEKMLLCREIKKLTSIQFGQTNKKATILAFFLCVCVCAAFGSVNGSSNKITQHGF